MTVTQSVVKSLGGMHVDAIEILRFAQDDKKGELSTINYQLTKQDHGKQIYLAEDSAHRHHHPHSHRHHAGHHLVHGAVNT